MNESDTQDLWHYLRPITSSQSPTTWIFLDSETVQVEHPVRSGVQHHVLRCWAFVKVTLLGGGKQREQWFQGTTQQQFWDCLHGAIGTRGRPVVMAHNLPFDLSVLGFWSRLETGEFQLELERSDEGNGPNPEGESAHKTGQTPVLADPPVIIPGQLRGRRCVMVDSYNLFRTSLEEMGQAAGRAKLELPAETASLAAWLERCEVDVQILRDTIMGTAKLVSDQLGSPWKHTAAGLSWGFFRRNYLSERTWLVHRDAHALALERWCYYGGQVWTGFIGEVYDSQASGGQVRLLCDDCLAHRPGPVFVLDQQGFYPWLMSANPAPCRLLFKGDSQAQLALEVLQRGRIAAACVLINSPTWTFPVRLDRDTSCPVDPREFLAADMPPGNRSTTIHATGEFWTCLCGDELRVALIEGVVKAVDCFTLYDTSSDLQRCAEALLTLRQEARQRHDRPMERLVKLISNSLAGKFGQRRAGWRHCPGKMPAVLWGEWVEHDFQRTTTRTFRSLAGTVEELIERTEAAHSMPIVSACITAAGRVTMASLRNVAGAGHVYYQDTDSLHVDGSALTHLDMLGALALDKPGRLRIVNTHRTARYCGAKHYRLDNAWTVAGVKRHATQLSDALWSQREWERLRSILNSNRPTEPRSHMVLKRLSLCHPTGKLLADGQVEPWRLG